MEKIKVKEEKIRGCYFIMVGEEDSLDDISAEIWNDVMKP